MILDEVINIEGMAATEALATIGTCPRPTVPMECAGLAARSYGLAPDEANEPDTGLQGSPFTR